MNPVVSVVIVHYDTPEALKSCLLSLFQYAPKVDIEPIIADNGPDVERTKTAIRRFPGVKHIDMGANSGFAKAANRGISAATGDYLLLLNPDAKILPGTLEAMIAYLAGNPNVGAVGPRHLDPNEKLQLSWGRFPNARNEMVRKALHLSVQSSFSPAKRVVEDLARSTRNVDWLSGSCLLVTKRAAEKAGPLDERFFLYFEDIDWCRSIRDVGLETHYLYEAPILHVGGLAAARHRIDAAQAYRESQFSFIRKHFGFWTMCTVRCMVAAKATMELLKSLFNGSGEDHAGLHRKVLRLAVLGAPKKELE